MIAFGLFLASLVSKARWVNLLGFMFLAACIGYRSLSHALQRLHSCLYPCRSSLSLSLLSFAMGATSTLAGTPPLYTVSSAFPFLTFLNGILPFFHYSKVRSMSLYRSKHARGIPLN